MRSLKQIRLVYRQHLLPPLVVPFEKLIDYQKIISPNRASLSSKEDKNRQLKIMNQINETLITQIIKIRANFIVPLKDCPFYYEQLDKTVSSMMKGGFQELSYLQSVNSIPFSQKLNLLQKVNRSYNQFRKDLHMKNQTFYKKVRYIPVFIYQKAQDLTINKDRHWNQLSDLQKLTIRQKYEIKVQGYWDTLNKIAEQESMQVDSLLQLVKTQLNPPLSNGLKKLLFPTQFRTFYQTSKIEIKAQNAS